MTQQPGNRRTPSSGRPAPRPSGRPTPRKATAPRKTAATGPARPGAAGRPPKTKAPKKKRTGKQWVWLGVRWLVAGLLALVLVAVAAFFVIYKTTDIPDANKAWQVQTSYVYYDDGKTPIGTFTADSQNRTSIPYDQMPQSIKDAVVAAEDHSFWTNNGVDIKGIIRAARSNASGGAQQGASTITQQYVKILYLGHTNGHLSYSEKLKEIFVALKIHNKLSKQQILEGYLNTVYFDRGAYGIEAAAESYFQVHAKQLTLQQSAVLASILNSPSHLDPASSNFDGKAALKARYDYTLSWMAKLGSIPEAQAEKAEKRLPAFPKQASTSGWSGQKGHAMSLVRSQLEALGFTDDQIDGGGLHVTTTLNQADMEAVEKGVDDIWNDGPSGLPGLKDDFSSHAKNSHDSLHTAVASVEPGTGALKAFYGGQPYQDSQQNWAVLGGSVGSTMKAVTLTTALEAGFSLKDTFQGDTPYTFPDGTTVTNEGQSLSHPYGTPYGRVTAITAMQQSVNTAFVDMTESIPDGPDKILANAAKMGIPPTKADKASPGIPSTSRDLVPDARVTLGRAIISPINMANTYATIAAEGERADVHVVSKVTDPSGAVLYQFQGKPQRAMPQDVADDVSYALQQVASGGTGYPNASPSALGRPDAGKTGTATAEAPDGDQYVSSAWYVGFTPQLSTAVMYVRGDGNDPLNWKTVTDKTPWMPSYFGADYPAATWNAVMTGETKDQEVQDFPSPQWVSGTPPQTGHDPYIPPAPPSNQAPSHPQSHQPTIKKPVNKPTHKPSKSSSPHPPPSSTAPTQPTPPPSSSTVCVALCVGGGGGGDTGGGGGDTGGGGDGGTTPPADPGDTTGAKP